MTSPSHTSAHSSEGPNQRSDPCPDDPSSCDHAMQPGSAPQSEGTCQPSAPEAATASNSDAAASNSNAAASNSSVAHQSAPTALEPGLTEEDKGLALEQEHAEEEGQERPGDVMVASGDPGVGTESELGPGLVAEGWGGGGELELPEEGWMWSVSCSSS